MPPLRGELGSLRPPTGPGPPGSAWESGSKLKLTSPAPRKTGRARPVCLGTRRREAAGRQRWQLWEGHRGWWPRGRSPTAFKKAGCAADTKGPFWVCRGHVRGHPAAGLRTAGGTKRHRLSPAGWWPAAAEVWAPAPAPSCSAPAKRSWMRHLGCLLPHVVPGPDRAAPWCPQPPGYSWSLLPRSTQSASRVTAT